MRCPICRRQTTRKGNPYRPFCSERCKLLDLNNWFSERYRLRIPADSVNQPKEAPSSQPVAKGDHA
jgi:endogenous inhibitor of DNA gyrase (YacG/DUF329 family)